MKEIHICLSVSWCSKIKIGAFGYVIKSEQYNSSGSEGLSETTNIRLLLLGVIDAFEEIQDNIENIGRITIFSNQTKFLRDVIFCTPFKAV